MDSSSSAQRPTRKGTKAVSYRDDDDDNFEEDVLDSDSSSVLGPEEVKKLHAFLQDKARDKEKAGEQKAASSETKKVAAKAPKKVASKAPKKLASKAPFPVFANPPVELHDDEWATILTFLPALDVARLAGLSTQLRSLLAQERWAGALTRKYPDGVVLLEHPKQETPMAAYCALDERNLLCRLCYEPLSKAKGGIDKAAFFFFPKSMEAKGILASGFYTRRTAYRDAIAAGVPSSDAYASTYGAYRSGASSSAGTSMQKGEDQGDEDEEEEEEDAAHQQRLKRMRLMLAPVAGKEVEVGPKLPPPSSKFSKDACAAWFLSVHPPAAGASSKPAWARGGLHGGAAGLSSQWGAGSSSGASGAGAGAGSSSAGASAVLSEREKRERKANKFKPWGGEPPSASPPAAVCASCKSKNENVMPLTTAAREFGVARSEFLRDAGLPISEGGQRYSQMSYTGTCTGVRSTLTPYARAVALKAYGGDAAALAKAGECKKAAHAQSQATKKAELAERKALGNLPWEQLYVLHHPTTTVFSANKTRPRLSLGAIKWLACYHVPAGVTPPKNFVQGFGCCTPSEGGEVGPPPASSDDVSDALLRAYAELDAAKRALPASMSTSPEYAALAAAVAAADVAVAAAVERFRQAGGSMMPMRFADDLYDEDYMHAIDEIYGYPDE